MAKNILSQNFLKDPELVKRLVRQSSIGEKDIVLEIGPGRGIITNELLQIASQVIAIEKDASFLFKSHPRLNLIYGDFLEFTPPTYNYKVFSNIPFSITGDIVKKLLNDDFLQEAYLIVQKEAVQKFMGKTLVSVLYYPWWEMQIIHEFKRTDFSPVPKVDSVLLHIKRRVPPLVKDQDKQIYLDYAAYYFGRNKKYKHLPLPLWPTLYKSENKIKGAYAKLQKEQNQLPKIHRTRNDTGWRKFKSKR